MKKLIVANWKLNPTSLKEAKELFDAVKAAFAKASAAEERVDVVICPPFVYLPLLKGLTLGAQDVAFEEKGAFTGEVSAAELKDLNVEYVIVGHSERRKYFGETNETVNKKLQKVLNTGLKVIFCIGENEGEDKTVVLEQQITEGLKDIGQEHVKNMVIAYEPVWAIGTGKNCSIQDTKSAVELIKKNLSNVYGQDLADGIQILYGGSVNAQNSEEYLKDGEVNGLLVGGASLKAEEFVKIVLSA